MTAEGNVADTGIVEEVNQLIAEKKASDQSEALELLKQQAKRDKDKEKMQKEEDQKVSCSKEHLPKLVCN
jgi:hypothetical protein